jgi:hypothetical protein
VAGYRLMRLHLSSHPPNASSLTRKLFMEGENPFEPAAPAARHPPPASCSWGLILQRKTPDFCFLLISVFELVLLGF